MDLLSGIAQTIRILSEGGTMEDLRHNPGFQYLLGVACWVVPSTLIALGIGLTGWRETPLAFMLGFSPQESDANWAERARDLDHDGFPDF
jgi:hypothetical protein